MKNFIFVFFILVVFFLASCENHSVMPSHGEMPGQNVHNESVNSSGSLPPSQPNASFNKSENDSSDMNIDDVFDDDPSVAPPSLS